MLFPLKPSRKRIGEIVMKKTTAMLLTAALSLSALTACGGETAATPTPAAADPAASAAVSAEPTAEPIKTVTEGMLTVALSPDFAPMEFVDASKEGQDRYVGFDPTLAKYLAENMGLELVISPMDFNACQTAVSMGTVDMAISGFSWTAAREENYNLSDTYHAGDNEDGQTTICMKSAGDKYADAPNMEGLKAGAQGASLQEIMVKEQLPNATLINYSDITTGVMQLRNGDFDIMAVADGNAEAIIAANPDVALTGFDFEVDPKYTDNLILMQKGNDALTEKVNELLAKAVEENKYPGWYDEAKALANIGTEVSFDEQGNEIK